MSIVCGTDFSPASLKAARAAGHLASRLGLPLKLVHVIDVPAESLMSPWRSDLVNAAHLALNREAEHLRSLGITAEAQLLEGRPDEALTEFARDNGAQLIVVSALGSRSSKTWQVGGSADRIAQLATCPALVIRQVEKLDAWLEGKQPLKVMLGVDRTEVSHEALNFVGELRRAGPCEVTITHLYWAQEEYHRLGFTGVRSIVDPDPEVERLLRKELVSELPPLPGSGSVDFRVELCVGRPADRLAALADDSGMDLVVVGSHQRNLVDRLWSGSVSRSVLHNARTNVACVSMSEVSKSAVQIPSVRSILVATDFSEIGDAAIPWGYGVADRGAVVHLVTVHSPEKTGGPLVPRDIFEAPGTPSEQVRVQELRRQLEAREPAAAAAGGLTTQFHVLSSDNVGSAISQAAERLNVDLVVLGTHGRKGMARAVLGSVAQDVAIRSPRPVTLVRPRGASR